MVNFGLLPAEICCQVWGTPANFNRVRVLAALLHGTLLVGVSQTLRRWTEGATYIRQGGHQVGYWPTFLVYCILYQVGRKTVINQFCWHNEPCDCFDSVTVSWLNGSKQTVSHGQTANVTGSSVECGFPRSCSTSMQHHQLPYRRLRLNTLFYECTSEPNTLSRIYCNAVTANHRSVGRSQTLNDENSEHILHLSTVRSYARLCFSRFGTLRTS